MELRPHDLIRINTIEDLLMDDLWPAWVEEALSLAPYVVVRRALPKTGLVPVGIRGLHRGERWATWITGTVVTELIRPEMLLADLSRQVVPMEASDVMRSLQKIAPILNDKNLNWGPTGSVAYELATGIQTITAGSDLDLVLRCSRPLSVAEGRGLLIRLSGESLVRLDIQLDTPMGGVSLADYVNCSQVLVKTFSGPMLVDRNSLWMLTGVHAPPAQICTIS